MRYLSDAAIGKIMKNETKTQIVEGLPPGRRKTHPPPRPSPRGPPNIGVFKSFSKYFCFKRYLDSSFVSCFIKLIKNRWFERRFSIFGRFSILDATYFVIPLFFLFDIFYVTHTGTQTYSNCQKIIIFMLCHSPFSSFFLM